MTGKDLALISADRMFVEWEKSRRPPRPPSSVLEQLGLLPWAKHIARPRHRRIRTNDPYPKTQVRNSGTRAPSVFLGIE